MPNIEQSLSTLRSIWSQFDKHFLSRALKLARLQGRAQPTPEWLKRSARFRINQQAGEIMRVQALSELVGPGYLASAGWLVMLLLCLPALAEWQTGMQRAGVSRGRQFTNLVLFSLLLLVLALFLTCWLLVYDDAIGTYAFQALVNLHNQRQAPHQQPPGNAGDSGSEHARHEL